MSLRRFVANSSFVLVIILSLLFSGVRVVFPDNNNNLRKKDVTGELKGDLNGNGQVDILDIVALIRILRGEERTSPVSDLTADGKTDILDLIAIINLLADNNSDSKVPFSEERAEETSKVISTANEIIGKAVIKGIDTVKLKVIAESITGVKGVKEVSCTNNSIIVRDDNNIMHAWIFDYPRESGTGPKLGSSGPMLNGIGLSIVPQQVINNKKAVLINALYNDIGGFYWDRVSFNIIENALEHYGYDVSSRYGQYADVNFFKNDLEGAGCYILDGHGGAIGEDRFIIQTGEEIPDDFQLSEELIEKYWNDMVNQRIWTVTVQWYSNEQGYKDFFAVSNKLIEYYYKKNDFQGAFVYCGACQGLKNESMAKAFTSKGASSYAGWTEIQSISLFTAEKLVTKMGDGSSLEETINGLDDYFKKEITDYGVAELKVYPYDTGGDIQLTAGTAIPVDFVQLYAWYLDPLFPVVSEGESFAAWYLIYNPNSQEEDVNLDLRYVSGLGVYGEFLPETYTVKVLPGFNWYGRPCTVQPGMEQGNYSVAWYILTTKNSWIDRSDFEPDMVTVTSNKTVTTLVIRDLVMRSLPAGSFQMGSTDHIYERPIHTVNLDAFNIGAYEITQAQYRSVTGSNPSQFSGNDNRPVEQVSWYEAVTFCNKLSENQGFDPCYNLETWECDFSKNGFRLPTEAEWEYAARAGTISKFYLGESESDLARAGWYDKNSGVSTHPVGEKEANSWGLYDVHGNVWEWCNDKWASYSKDISLNNPTGPEKGYQRAVRGGGYNSGTFDSRVTARMYQYPDRKFSYLGFRVVRR